MKKLKNSYFKRSLKFFKNCKWYIVLLTIIDILLGILSFIDPIITAHLITYITTSKYQLVITFILLMLIMLIISNILYYCTNIVWRNKIRTKVLYNIREEMINNVMNLRVSTYDKYNTGLFQERIGNDPIDVARVVNSGQNYFIKCLTQIAVIVYVFCINAIIGIIYLLGMVLSALIDNYKQSVDKENNVILKESTEKSGSLLTEVIRGIRDIKLLNFKNNVKKDVMENMDIVANNISKTDNFYSKITYIQNVILSLTTALVLIIGILFVKRGTLTVANLIVLYLYHNNIFSLMDNYSWLKNSLKRYELGIERIFSLNDSNKFPKESFGNIDIENFKGKIELKKVSFGYSKDKLILNNLSLKLEPKDTVAIVGASGSGKTTVLNLITKSYNATGGKVLLDNVNINDISEKTLRENVSIISQNPYIFNMTIKDNLLMVKPDASKEELDKVCKEASIYDYIMSLPKKYDSLIGEGGLNLSGGQRQRLAIARALLKECKILLLDEATSALDNITQNEIQKSIDIITKDYTIIIVAHRLSTIKACNKIYMLDKGKIIASGTHEELLKTCESYQRLYDSETISES